MHGTGREDYGGPLRRDRILPHSMLYAVLCVQPGLARPMACERTWLPGGLPTSLRC